MTGRHGRAARLAGALVLLLTAAGCAHLRTEIEAEIEAEAEAGRTAGAARPAPPAPGTSSPPPRPVSPGPLPSPPPPTPTRSPGCPPGGLALAIIGEDSAMGHRVATLQLRNCGDRPFSVKGHPGVELLDTGRQPVDVTISHKNDYSFTGRRDDRPRRLTLAPDGTAAAVVHWNNRVTSFDGAPTPGAHIRVTPAPGEAPISLPLAVDLGTDGTLDVTSWAAGPVGGR